MTCKRDSKNSTSKLAIHCKRQKRQIIIDYKHSRFTN